MSTGRRAAEPVGFALARSAEAKAPRIDVIAPSGAVLSPESFETGLEQLRALGCVVRNRVASRSWLRFADTDDGRLAQIHDAAQAHDVDIVMIARGGYGLSRLLDRIDWQRVAESVRRGVRWVGFSDFTAFQSALFATTGVSSWAGPAVCGDFGRGDPDPYMLEQFRCLLEGHAPTVEWTEPGSDDGRWQPPSDEREAQLQLPSLAGTLWGGNLAMLASLAGTRWMPQVEGGLLFVEDVAEHPYRVERMLLQLLHAGVLGQQRAILFGSFSDWAAAPHDNGFGLATVAGHLVERLGIPVIHGLPFGHIRRRAVLGVGLRYRLSELRPDAAAPALESDRRWRLEPLRSEPSHSQPSCSQPSCSEPLRSEPLP